MRQTKRIKKIKELTKDIKAESTLEEAVKTLKNMPKLKFDESIDLSIKLGVDVKKNDQQVRGTITLPHGTGKKVRILVLAPEDKAKEARNKVEQEKQQRLQQEEEDKKKKEEEENKKNAEIPRANAKGRNRMMGPGGKKPKTPMSVQMGQLKTETFRGSSG